MWYAGASGVIVENAPPLWRLLARNIQFSIVTKNGRPTLRVDIALPWLSEK